MQKNRIEVARYFAAKPELKTVGAQKGVPYA
jgi:hypothetical protein